MSVRVDVMLVVNGEEPALSSGEFNVWRSPPALRFPIFAVSGRRGIIVEVYTAAPKFCLPGRVVQRRTETGVVTLKPAVFSSSK